MNTISLEIKGFYKNNPPIKTSNIEGIYIVYAGESTGTEHCKLNRIIFIGESDTSISKKLFIHKRRNDWMHQLRPGESLYFAIAAISGEHREIAEAALIYKNKPVCNKDGIKHYNYGHTLISGKHYKNLNIYPLQCNFTLY